MKAMTSMTVDTTWGNSIVLTIESELDNAHQLTTAEICRLQIATLSLMVAEVRRLNDRTVSVRDEEEESTPLPPPHVGERDRLTEVERSAKT